MRVLLFALLLSLASCLSRGCSVLNGGCDPLTTCTVVVNIVTCGPCPVTHYGTGQTGCTPCPTGMLDCDRITSNQCEINSSLNATNCGGCGIVCSSANMSTVTCTAGICDGTCSPGFSDCNNNKQLDGCETASDINNCGGCGIVCSSANMSSVSCTAGVCNGTCNVGFADCNNNKQLDGCEATVNTINDPNNCGCGYICSKKNMATVTCSSGICNGTCKAGFADCNNNKQIDGCEAAVNTNTDPNNCGGCGIVCSTSNMSTVTCKKGVCSGTCKAGFTDCNNNKQLDGCEAAVNTNTDPNNCGGCGIVCSGTNMATVTCKKGICSGKCRAGFLNCNNNKQIDGCETQAAVCP
jgi:hypothetical protein